MSRTRSTAFVLIAKCRTHRGIKTSVGEPLCLAFLETAIDIHVYKTMVSVHLCTYIGLGGHLSKYTYRYISNMLLTNKSQSYARYAKHVVGIICIRISVRYMLLYHEYFDQIRNK